MAGFANCVSGNKRQPMAADGAWRDQMTPRRRRFLGTSSHPVDKKGRMSIAKRFQNALDRDDEGRPAGVLCVERSAGTCLWIFNDEGFDREMEEFGTSAMKGGGDLARQRDFFEFTAEFTLDASGRLVVPQAFRELVGIHEEAVAVGINDRMEIWAKEAWDERERGSGSPLVGRRSANAAPSSVRLTPETRDLESGGSGA